MGQTLRILSANLLNGRACMESLIDTVHALAVDVLALQEVSPEQAEALAGVLPHGQIRPDYNYVGMALATRRPCDIHLVPMSWGFGQTVRLEPEDWNGLSRPIEISNIHIAAPHMYWPAPGFYLRRKQIRELMAYLETRRHRAGEGGESVVGAETVDPVDSGHAVGAVGTANSAQAEGVGPVEAADVATDASAQVGPTPRPNDAPRSAERVGRSPDRHSAPARVLVGDFNSTPYWPAYRRIASQFTDAAVAVATRRGRSTRATWGPWPGAPKLFRIDHGFVRDIEVEEFRVLEIVGSDHSAFVMDLSLD